MIVLHDSPGADLAHVEAMAAADDGFGMSDYVLIQNAQGEQWVGQIVQPNRNISTVGERMDPTILHGLELMQNGEDVRAVDSVQVYDILILGSYDGRQLTTPRMRPLPGSRVVKLDPEALIQILGLPELVIEEDEAGVVTRSNAIGRMATAPEVPICMSGELFNYHLMVVGGTGSGKSNAAANLVNQAVRSDRFVIIHDAKPDYALASLKNTDPAVHRVWDDFMRWGLRPEGLKSVKRAGFNGRCDPSKVDGVLGFWASDFEPDMLASLFFPYTSENNQYEAFASAAEFLREQENKSQYTIDDIFHVIERRMQNDTSPSEQIHKATGNAALQKIRRRRRDFPWLDCVGDPVDETLRGNQKVHRLELERFMRPGLTLVIDYQSMGEAAYALVLSFFLRMAMSLRRQRIGAPTVQLVDEAHRIFDNESAYSRELERVFSRAMREGRSVDHGIIVSLQNASQIPAQVLNNINSKIVMRQNGKSEAESATQTMGREFVSQSMRLGTGQALVQLFESNAVALAQMAPSPFELMRTDNTSAIVTESFESVENAIGGDGTAGRGPLSQEVSPSVI